MRISSGQALRKVYLEVVKSWFAMCQYLRECVSISESEVFLADSGRTRMQVSKIYDVCGCTFVQLVYSASFAPTFKYKDCPHLLQNIA